MSEDSTTYLDRYAQKKLTATLLDIESHADDLADTIVKRAVITRRDTTSFRRPKKLRAKSPVNEGAQDVADELRTTLSTAIRHVCETRCIQFMPVGYTHHRSFIGPLREDERRVPAGYDASSLLVLTKWLRKHMISFAMTEGCVEWADTIDACAHRLRKVIDLPPDDYVHIDPAQVRRANRQVITLGTIDVVARRLGELGDGLNARRIRTLVKRGELQADSEDGATGTKFYRLGDVLDAHHRHARRRSAG